jgi:ABC-type glycerol-3-phosphate transport system substrate-binding protein
MRRTITVGLAGIALALAACGGGGSSSGDAQKVCDELAAGTAPFDIWQSMRDAYPTQGDWAVAAKDWTSTTCPDQLANNEQLRNILSNNEIDF